MDPETAGGAAGLDGPTEVDGLDDGDPDAADLEAGGDDEDGEYRGAPPAVRRWWPVAALALSVLGLCDAAYLTYEHFTQGLLPCPANSVFDCAKVTTSAESHLLGIPVAVLGLAFFASMVVVNVPPLWRTRHLWVAWARLGMVSVGLIMVVYLVSAEVFTIKAVCLWCTGVHVITVALFILVLSTFPALLAAGRSREVDGGG